MFNFKGPFYVCLSSTIFLLSFLFYYSFWNNLNIYVKFIGLLLVLIQAFSYFYTFIINPGLPKKNIVIADSPKKMTKGYKYCEYCRILMNLDEKTNHCLECNVCIVGK